MIGTFTHNTVKPMNIWYPQFLITSPLFAPLAPVSQSLCQRCTTWPTLEDYNAQRHAISSNPCSLADKPIHFVPQTISGDTLIDQYEARIYLTGGVSTRAENWHDFFNAMVWLTFPKTKAMLNAQQYEAIQQRWGKSKQRTSIENTLTLFDENGAIVVSDDVELLDLIKHFHWHELFWQQRKKLMQHMKFFVFGHSLYEKALQPYLGMTAHALLLIVPSSFFKNTLHEQLQILDKRVVEFFSYSELKDKLTPLPILGVPDWHPDNNAEEFYFNTKYFRAKNASINNCDGILHRR